MAESTTRTSPQASAPAHVALATVFQVRDDVLSVLLWERARDPFTGAWALPGGTLVAGETLEPRAQYVRHARLAALQRGELRRRNAETEQGRGPIEQPADVPLLE